MENDTAGSSNKLALFIICLVLVGAGLAGVFVWQNSKLDNLQNGLNDIKASKPADESTLLDTDTYQAVFLSSGQVYFGKITEMNQKYITLSDIYYLHSDTIPIIQFYFGTNMEDVSLIKLGCELHGPEDKMVINRDKIDFWENLKDSGETVKSIKAYQRAHPKGEKCPTPPPDNNIKMAPSSEA